MDQNRRSRTKNSCSGENANAKNCTDPQADRRRNSTEGFQPRSFVGFPCLGSPNTEFKSEFSPASAGGLKPVAGGRPKNKRPRHCAAGPRSQGVLQQGAVCLSHHVKFEAAN